MLVFVVFVNGFFDRWSEMLSFGCVCCRLCMICVMYLWLKLSGVMMCSVFCMLLWLFVRLFGSVFMCLRMLMVFWYSCCFLLVSVIFFGCCMVSFVFSCVFICCR